MSSVRHDRVAAQLWALDVATLGPEGIDALLGSVRQLESWLGSLKIAAARRIEELRTDGRAGRVAVAVGQLWGKNEARRVEQRRDALATTPALANALTQGTITTAHVDAVAAAIRRTPAVADHDTELTHLATTVGPDQFAEMCTRMAMMLSPDHGIDELSRQRAASTVKRWVDRFTGMYHLTAQLDPERGAHLWAALDTHIERHYHSGADPDLSNDQRAATALHTLATTRGDGDGGGDDGGGGGGSIGATIDVIIDLATLQHGLHRDSTVRVTGGGTLPVDTIRRIACTADIIPHVLSGDSVVIDVGRTKRLATHRQRRALAVMYPTCAFPGCDVAFAHTRIHHLTPFDTGGPTDLHNLLPLCDRHHHDAHEGRWQLTLDPTTRTLTTTRPDGTVHAITTLRRQRAPAA